MVLLEMCSSPITLSILLVSVSCLALCSAKSIEKRAASTSSSSEVESSEMAIPMSTAQADYALSLLRESGGAEEPLILSPFSIAVALAVTYAGAGGNTKKEMNALLSKGNSDEQLHSFLTKQVEEMSKANEGYTLSTANRLYVHNGFPLKDSFVNAVKAKYSGQLQQADFKQATAVAKEINQWVEGQTHEKIKNLISPDNVKEDSKLFIVNAVYFKGDWATKFEKNLTKMKPFYSAPEKQREVEMMRRKDKYFYLEDGDMQVLGLPYKGDEVRMFIFLPVEKYGLSKFLQDATGQKLLDYINNAKKAEVEVEMPKFKLEKKFDLNDVLIKLGVKDAFTAKADFSGISDVPLYISDVIHKAFVEVNEEGTEAAAATAIGMRLRSAPMAMPPLLRFIADHPFIFAIVKGDSLLFVGKYI